MKSLTTLIILGFCLLVLTVPSQAAETRAYEIYRDAKVGSSKQELLGQIRYSSGHISFWNHRGRWALHLRYPVCGNVTLAVRQKICRKARADLRAHLWLRSVATKRLNPWPVPNGFMAQILCVHDGWTHSSKPPHFPRTSDISDNIPGGAGEASWRYVGTFGGGLQFMVNTWNRAAAVSKGKLSYVSSTADIAEQPPAAQIYAAFMIVTKAGSWYEWPQTARACGII